MSKPSVDLACLDLAGTTVRDEGVVDAAFLEALEHVGVGPGDARLADMRAYVAATMGTSKLTVFRALLGNEDAARQANAAFEDAYDARVDAGMVEAMPGAVETVVRLRAAGVRVALLTGFSAVTRDRLVEALGWQGLADLLVCPEAGVRGRPHPDMVLAAVMRLGIDDVARVVVVGDTAADVVAGRGAGASVVAGVLSGHDDATRLLGAGATHLLEGIAQLPDLLGIA